MSKPSTVNAARKAGYVHTIYAYGPHHDLHLLVRATADLEGRFTAFCLDELELISVNGWLFDIEDATELEAA